MPRPSWNEIEHRALRFATRWEGETYEKGESQSFWGEFLDIFGIDRRRHGAMFEQAIRKGSGRQGFIDLFWPGKLLAEQKSAGGDTGKARLQAYDYLETMPDHDLPQAIVVSDFATFDLYDPLTMPPALAQAHAALDRAVDRLSRPKPFDSDSDRVALLFERYGAMTA